jgi:hypothetical protein
VKARLCAESFVAESSLRSLLFSDSFDSKCKGTNPKTKAIASLLQDDYGILFFRKNKVAFEANFGAAPEMGRFRPFYRLFTGLITV